MITTRLSSALADRYKIESRRGEGGMATVYLAEDLKHKRKGRRQGATREDKLVPCYVMPYVDGESVREKLNRQAPQCG